MAKKTLGQQQRMQSAGSPSVKAAENNRQIVHKAVLGDNVDNPNFVKAVDIINGDHSYSSPELGEKNTGS